MKTLSQTQKKTLEFLAPPPDLLVSEWADAERRLSAGASAEPGQWRTDRAPYLRGMMDAIREDGCHRVVVMSSAQIGKTEFVLNTIGYHIHHDPAPMLVIYPSLELAEAFSKDRLTPMIQGSPALSAKVSDSKAKDGGNTILHKQFDGGHITMAGSNSAKSLSSRPVRVVLCDEVDRYVTTSEGDAIKLAQKRATTFYNRVFIEVSTPTIDGRSRIQQSFEESDQRRFHIPCPKCKGFQTIEWKRIKWDLDKNGNPINVRHECIHCGEFFDDSQKLKLLLRGKWIAEKPFRGTAGFHLSELYSPWVKWSSTVAEFLVASQRPETLRVWVNTALGEVFLEKGDAPEWERLYHTRENYKIGTVPDGVYFLTAGVDVQANRLECEIVGWGKDKQSWSIDYRVLVGDTSTAAPWLALNEVLNEDFPDSNGELFSIRAMGVDSGFNTQMVYDWARSHSPTRVLATKGSDSIQNALGTPTAVDVNIRGKRISRGTRVWPVGVSTLKSELYAWLRIQKPTDPDAPYPGGYCHFPQYGEEFFKMLTAEQIIKRLVKGYTRFGWEKTRERNEALDCRVLARAMAAFLGMDRFKESNWESLRRNPTIPKVQSTTPKLPSASQRPKRKSDFW